MNIQQAIYTLLAVLLPVLGIILPGIFKQDKLSQQVNGIIATVVIVVIAALQAWSEGQLNIINPWLDFGIVLTGISALLAGPFRGVDAYFQSNVPTSSKPQPSPATLGQSSSIFTEFVAVLTPLITALQQYTETTKAAQSTQIAPVAAGDTAQPVHGSGDVGTAETPQPSQDGVQAQIPAFTTTAEIPVVSAPQTQSAPQPAK